MWTTCLEREETQEVINISDTRFEWYKENKLVRTGLVVNKEADIRSLIEKGFVIVE